METPKVVLYLAVSLDGYIARPDGSVDWLFDVEGDGGDNGYAKFYGRIGALMMGRRTYDEVLKLSEQFPYKGKPCYVVTRSEQPSSPDVTFTAEDLVSLVPKIKAEASGDVWLVGGGQLTKAFLEKGLLDRIEMTVIPKILGEGIPLFPEGTDFTLLKLVTAEPMGQMISLAYEVLKR